MKKDCGWIYDQIKESGVKYKVINENETGELWLLKSLL